MNVLQFDVSDEEFELSDVALNSVCYTGTHDNDTTVGWFQGGPDDIRSADEIQATRKNALRVTGGTPKIIHTDMIRAAFSTRAAIAIAPMQDFLGLGSEARLNIPGTTNDNWRWRMVEGQLEPALIEWIAGAVDDSSRSLAPRLNCAS